MAGFYSGAAGLSRRYRGPILHRRSQIGCTPQTLNDWVKKAEVDSGKRAGVPTDMAERINALERENLELRQANEILRKASAYFAPLSANEDIRLPGNGTELDRRFKP